MPQPLSRYGGHFLRTVMDKNKESFTAVCTDKGTIRVVLGIAYGYINDPSNAATLFKQIYHAATKAWPGFAENITIKYTENELTASKLNDDAELITYNNLINWIIRRIELCAHHIHNGNHDQALLYYQQSIYALSAMRESFKSIALRANIETLHWELEGYSDIYKLKPGYFDEFIDILKTNVITL